MMAARDAGAPLPPRAVVLTFDDGFRNFIERAAPVLEGAGFRATVFAVAGYCGRSNIWPGQAPRIPVLPLLDAAELRTLAARGFEVGAHGMTHARFDRLAHEQVRREMLESRRSLEDALGEGVTSFAYPYGRTTPEALRLAAAHYRAACTDEMRVASSEDAAHALGRLDMYYYRGARALRFFETPVGDGYVAARRLGRRLRRLIP
jgi:peptidoglycan/xylan/chitin deacetylase (PgdA/CDA1 family)